MRSLNIQDFYFLNPEGTKHPLTARQLCIFLIQNNKTTPNVKCQGQYLSPSQLQENLKAVEELDVDSIDNGYWCSTLEPFLCLLCELFKVRIEHDFNGVTIVYDISNYRKILKYRSDVNHFWYG